VTNTGPQLPWWRRKGAYKLLSAPLLLVVVGALLSTFLPRIFDESDNSAKEQATTDLASEMDGASEDVMAIAFEFAGLVAKEETDPQARFNLGLRNWKKSSAEIEGKLPDDASRLRERWHEYRKVVEDLYFLSGTGVERRCQLTQNVRNFLPHVAQDDLRCSQEERTNRQREEHVCLNAGVNQFWKLLAACNADDPKRYGYARGDNFKSAYESVSDRMLEQGAVLSKELRDR
jgi:hypothetical protein